MATKADEIKLGYRILKIQTTKFEFKDIDDAELDSLFKNNGVGLNINVERTTDSEKSTITIDIRSRFFKKEGEIILVEHFCRTSYFIEGLRDVYDKKSDTFEFPKNFMIQLHGIAYTHARALLATEISSTCYRDKYFLPIIDSTILVDLSVNKE